MIKIARLKREARASATWRGHDMGRWHGVEFWTRMASCECKRCGMSVAVDPAPPMNGIDICGEAVALNCEGTET